MTRSRLWAERVGRIISNPETAELPAEVADLAPDALEKLALVIGEAVVRLARRDRLEGRPTV